ncbi:flagellar motor protein MotB [Prosthecobacter algae]|uniref:Flagellar motor protein MotB n=1 Tax=Prosthecobacter algae TaxID=1144682 RepID=A0ABP9P8X4_9BACT
MFSRTRRTKQTPSEENPFVLSFSDLMAGLLAIFILALIVTMLELQKRKEELLREQEKIKITLVELIGSLQEIQTIQTDIVSALDGVSQRERSLTAMLEGIQDDLKERGVKVIVAENGSVLRIPEQGLSFASGKYDIPPLSERNATAIGHALAHALEQEVNRRMLDTVFIEGHTDAVPNTREMGNWGLSTYRAISLWNYWTLKPGELSKMKDLNNLPMDPSQLPRSLVSVSGYAETRSTHPPEIASVMKPDRPEDRRIDIRFTLAASEKKNLEDLQGDLKTMKAKTDALIEKLKLSDDNAP